MLEILCKQDELWRSYALKICGCRETADDLVQDMYLKLANHKKHITRRLVFKTIRSIFLDDKKKKRIVTISLNDIPHTLKQNHCERLEKRYEALEILKDVDFFTREVLLLTHQYSLREAEEETKDENGKGVPYFTLNYYKKKGLKKLKEKHGNRKTG